MQVEPGDTVGVRYTGRLDNGDVFDSNADDGELLTFRVGDGDVIPGFDKAVLGLSKGDSRTVRIAPEDAYGERDARLVTKLARDLFEGDVEVGQHLDLEDQEGNVHHADVVGVEDDGVTVDLNHHLAGETLTFDITLEAIERA